MSFYSLKAKDNKLVDLPFDRFQGKTLLIVNTASKCGFTPQYKGLEELYKKYKDKDFIILGFPCNQFLFQEPANNHEIEEFCQINYGVTFPLMDKINVNGAKTHEVFKYLKSHATNSKKDAPIKWNFTKFIISSDGQTILRYEPTVEPSELDAVIRGLLSK